jgi:hypothetical protein
LILPDSEFHGYKDGIQRNPEYFVPLPLCHPFIRDTDRAGHKKWRGNIGILVGDGKHSRRGFWPLDFHGKEMEKRAT